MNSPSRQPLIECVPNFSEGRNAAKIQALIEAVHTVSGVKVLDVFSGESTNRTVCTFAGPPQPVLDAAYFAVKRAGEVIDMRFHKGTHIRVGAADVCPLIPLNRITLSDCVALSHSLAQKVAGQLGIPVYLYAHSASHPRRRSLSDIRSGQYEKLAEKMLKPEWRPDYGDPVFNPRAGAAVIGARNILIAYNINLNCDDSEAAHRVACRLRESGGKHPVTRNREPGKFKKVLAMGWFVPEYGISQVSMNILDFRSTPLHQIFEAARNEAAEMGLKVTGSEIVGLVPERALLDAGRFYLFKNGAKKPFSKPEMIRAASEGLGLSDIHPFDPETKILDSHFPMPLDRL